MRTLFRAALPALVVLGLHAASVQAADKIRVVATTTDLKAPWSDQKLAERVAQEAVARLVLMASAVGAVKGTDNYLDMIDYNVKAVAQALR